ncbi:MAG: hypothetical protein JW719_06285 [Pirellulales bacterium]|nr:hypothetical protein [Pirellulales bacterium]
MSDFTSCVLRAVLCAALLGTAGCGADKPEMGSVRGKVTLDGAPVSGGCVISYTESGRGAHAMIQSDGTFELETNEYGKGAVVGKHRLTVVAYDGNPTAELESDRARLLIPHKYTQPDSSGLSVVVSAGKEEHVVLELEK